MLQKQCIGDAQHIYIYIYICELFKIRKLVLRVIVYVLVDNLYVRYNTCIRTVSYICICIHTLFIVHIG